MTCTFTKWLSIFTCLLIGLFGAIVSAKDDLKNLPTCKVKNKKTQDNNKASHRIGICAIFQNDAPFMKEWIEFHKLQGVQHFYLYNNNSSDGYANTLSPYIKSGEVTLVNWPYSYEYADGLTWNDIQSNAYNHCLKIYGRQCDWIAFIDTDEFLFCPSGQPLYHYLNKFKEYGGVAANWLMFGTSHIYDLTEKDLMIELLTCSSVPNYHSNVHIKSIVQPRFTVNFNNPHYAHYTAGKFAVESDYTRIDGGHTHRL